MKQEDTSSSPKTMESTDYQFPSNLRGIHPTFPPNLRGTGLIASQTEEDRLPLLIQAEGRPSHFFSKTEGNMFKPPPLLKLCHPILSPELGSTAPSSPPK